MKSKLTILTLFITCSSFGQGIQFDTSHNSNQLSNTQLYSKTDFSQMDSLSLWAYSLYTDIADKSPVKPIGLLVFKRIAGIDDGISQKLYGHLWEPRMDFLIYNLSDSTYCFKKSLRTRVFSSCVPPNVGGDIIILGNYIFLSRFVCLSCLRNDTKVDYCRPVINYVFSKIDRTKITSLQSIAEQFVISKSD